MKKLNFGITLLASLFWLSCSDEEVTESVVIPEQPEEVANLLQQYNTDVAALQLMAEGGAKVVSYTENGTSGYKVMLDNGWTVNASASTEVDNDIPVLGINEAGYWVCQLNGTQTELTDLSGPEKDRKGSVHSADCAGRRRMLENVFERCAMEEPFY